MVWIRKSRPVWYKDAKWIFGFCFAFVLTLTLLLFNLFQLTSFKQAKNIFSFFTLDFFQVDKKFDQFYSEILAFSRENPDEYLSIPNTSIRLNIMGKDVIQMTKEELKKAIFSQIVKESYEKGLKAIVSEEELLERAGERKQQLQLAIHIFNFFNQKIHQRLKSIFLFFAVVSLFLLLPFIFFSFRFGKIFNVGLCFCIASFPSFSLLTILERTLPPKQIGKSNLQAKFLSEVAAPLIRVAQKNYRIFFLISLGLIFVGMIGGIGMRIKEKIASTKSTLSVSRQPELPLPPSPPQPPTLSQ